MKFSKQKSGNLQSKADTDGVPMMKKICGCLVLLGWLIGSLFSSAMAATEEEMIDALSNHFSSVPTMSGEFVQFGPNGEQTGGTFHLQRPGKLRFDYEDPSPLLLISNGKTVGVRNSRLGTWSYIPLRKTPLSLLLGDSLDIEDESIRSVSSETDITTIVLGDEKIFGDAEITLLFDPESQDLRQWTIKDAQGKETSVMIYNVEKNVSIPEDLFMLNAAAANRTKAGESDK